MPRKTVDPLRAKQQKQKKIAIAGGVLLLALVGFQGPKLLKRVHGGSQVPAWLQQSRDQTASGVAPAPAAGAAPSAAPAGAAPAPAAAPGALAADVAPVAAVGQLPAFSRFAGKDPFSVQVPLPSGGPAAGRAGTAGTPKPPAPPSPGGTKQGGTKQGGTAGGAPTAPAQPPAPAPASVVIAVNGVKSLVAVGADFPASSPFFHLLSATAHTARVSIAGGSYASGASSLTLRERKPVTLMNTADGTRYVLELFPQGTAVEPAATTAATTGTAPAATTSGG